MGCATSSATQLQSSASSNLRSSSVSTGMPASSELDAPRRRPNRSAAGRFTTWGLGTGRAMPSSSGGALPARMHGVGERRRREPRRCMRTAAAGRGSGGRCGGGGELRRRRGGGGARERRRREVLQCRGEAPQGTRRHRGEATARGRGGGGRRRCRGRGGRGESRSAGERRRRRAAVAGERRRRW
ncbi:hypothetical protein GQ55_3G478400 [Panicum hallii var. hallii]|uniref:Uncharacterized protein n=1 Tax=Panicum hallii var. hallii TaxID=1504633 RepID=A0A2T7EJJ3_9POAL|nr:hypothetical protein GQ55_3G478400 [Panicum hallii var. hallii]